jgi:signal transduction histidine kinase
MRISPRLRLIGLPLAVSAFGLVEAFVEPIQPRAAGAVLLVLCPLPLIARFRWPGPAAVIAVGIVVGQAAVGVDLSQPIAPVIVLGIAAYTLGAQLPLRTALLYGVVLVGMIVFTEVIQHGVKGSDPVFGSVLTFGSLSMGRVLQTRHQALEAAAAAEREVAVAQERTRIARELHDLIAHTVSVMVVQANAAEQVLHTDPDRAGVAIAEVQRAGRSALSETARLLDLLREGAEDGSAPQPGLADLRALISAVPGLEVELQVDDELPPLPPGAEVSLCRIVQESLTNVLKHSGSRRAAVRIVGADNAIITVVEDPGPPRRTDALPGGHGLIGMRERVEMYGGSLHAGTATGGRWVVEARIPAAAAA